MIITKHKIVFDGDTIDESQFANAGLSEEFHAPNLRVIGPFADETAF